MHTKAVGAGLILVVLLFCAWKLPYLNIMTEDISEEEAPAKVQEIKNGVIKIGVFEPLTGDNKEGGISELEGIRLANELYPVINGTKIELFVEDNKSDRYETVYVVSKLIDENKVTSMIGSWGSALSLAAGPIISEEGIPTVGASCTNPRITIGNSFYSRVSYIDTFQGTALANFAYKELKAKTVAILMESENEYSLDLGEYYMNAFAELNNYSQSILLEGYYKSGQKQHDENLLKIKTINPDVIFIPGNYKDVSEIAKQAKLLGIESTIIGTDTLDTQEFIESPDQSSNGVYYSTFYSHEIIKNEEGKKFLNAYKKKYGKDPNSFSALGYDAYLLIYDALKRVDKYESKEINDAIHLAKNVEGAAGMITMDQNGDTKRSVVIMKIISGEKRYVTSIEPAN